ncbi:hypothetical protein ABFV05_005086 [Capra hircus]
MQSLFAALPTATDGTARGASLTEASMIPDTGKVLDTCTCFITSLGYKPEHRCLTYARKAADVRALNYFSYWITLERRPLNFFKPIFGLVGRMMRCVNRPVLGHIIPQSAATEAAVEGSAYKDLG